MFGIDIRWMTILNFKEFLCSNQSAFVPLGTHWKMGIIMADSEGNWFSYGMDYSMLHQFWWPGMVMKMQKVISGCESCIQNEGAQLKAP